MVAEPPQTRCSSHGRGCANKDAEGALQECLPALAGAQDSGWLRSSPDRLTHDENATFLYIIRGRHEKIFS